LPAAKKNKLHAKQVILSFLGALAKTSKVKQAKLG